jgi:hypothetical protein
MLWFLRRQNDAEHRNGKPQRTSVPSSSKSHTTAHRRAWWQQHFGHQHAKGKTTTSHEQYPTKATTVMTSFAIGRSNKSAGTCASFLLATETDTIVLSLTHTPFSLVPSPLTRLDSDDDSFRPTVVNYYRPQPSDSPTTKGMASSSSSQTSSNSAAISFDNLHHHEALTMDVVLDSLCYSTSTATTPTMVAMHNESTPKRTLLLHDKSKNRSLVSFLNQADEAFHRLMHDHENDESPCARNNTTMMIPSSRTFEYDYEDDYNGSDDAYNVKEPAPADAVHHNNRIVPYTLTMAVTDGVSFLDMSVWSMDPYGTSVFGKENPDDPWPRDNDAKQDDSLHRPTTDIHRQEGPDEEDNEHDDEYEDNDDCSATTAVPRALRVRPTVTHDVSVLTMDPALYSNSRYVEC